MTNGSEAARRRERLAKEKGGEAKSQLKVNENAKSIVCNVCRQNFLCTIREAALAEHALNKHKKTVAECFPGFQQK